MPVLNRLLRYGLVGGTAAAVHIGVLLLLGPWMSLSLANPIAFLAASVAGYLGHALLTFREETGGRQFARRWLLLQYGVNISVCALLPLLKAPTLVLVFTPTLLNALIWSRAARFSAQARQNQNGQPPLLHADDLGLAQGVDAAILDLAQSGRLQGASLLVNGPSATAAVEAWRDLADPPPLTLHLCLTEGHRLPNCPDLPTGFGGLLLASLLPWQRRRIAPQLRTVLLQQISRYRQLTGLQHIRLDGHQHIHLVPLVLDAVLDLARRINHLGAHDTGTPTGRFIPEAVVAQPADRRSAQVAGSATALRAGHPTPAPGRTGNQPALRRSFVQWINVRNSVPPLLGNGLQLKLSRPCFTAGCADPPGPTPFRSRDGSDGVSAVCGLFQLNQPPEGMGFSATTLSPDARLERSSAGVV